ncbi:MAG: hypothetical protein A2754_02520 [Candidatus Magasanikbacteria bacterium RIFCSPHIGHO2_01_FULL_47_8]|uniref:THIF-type NAD/FAD binding fold domain-containing protein n=1 Tax=Candidatus Magasanikbacteria bacterium RIFCSPHIGHO2_01_FULL_47_8 TaxID=1798673 RepID=A0A1F6MBU2_9BACT|nr:MAG: hypothetical protein A2754_02520 [Candidatus Magasanikbacteria bacterium RIFCSPHIGHO2_01_FULL_47_8]
MRELNLSQQRGIFDSTCAKPVTLIGAGAVGSQVAVMLAKIGVPKIIVYDGDAIESHNIPMSAYRQNDLGSFKVEALRAIVSEQSGLVIDTVPKMYTGEPLKGTVVACVDTMEARKSIWQQVKRNPNVDILVDTRVAEEFVSVFAIAPCDEEDTAYYEHFLYPSNKALRPTCGHHGIIHVGAVAAAAVCANLTNWWQNGKKKRHFKELCVELECVD